MNFRHSHRFTVENTRGEKFSIEHNSLKFMVYTKPTDPVKRFTKLLGRCLYPLQGIEYAIYTQYNKKSPYTTRSLLNINQCFSVIYPNFLFKLEYGQIEHLMIYTGHEFGYCVL